MRIISPKQKTSRFRMRFGKKRKLLIFTVVLLIVAASGATYYVLANQSKAEPVANTAPAPEPEPEPEPIKYYSPLTGKLVDSEAATKTPVTGVMIENSPDARPQSGLKNSGVVFEAIAEGGITRFMVLYQQEKPQIIGPVRSLRLYDVDWLAAFDAGIAHVGGSLYALNEIRNGSYKDLDQFFNSGSYWRASDRYAPHNVYTSFDRLDALNSAKGYTKSSFTGFERTDGAAAKKLTATNITIDISSYLYNSTYSYSSKTNTYTRSQGGAIHTDREDGKITPSVVIAMMVNEKTVMQDGYREDITTIGSGKATIFQNGTAISATWSKASKTKQIVFKDSKGKVVPLVRGQTWIAAVSNSKGSVEWK
jgi:hypothetical protein